MADNKDSKFSKWRKKCCGTFMCKVLRQEKKPHWALMTLELILSFILDVLVIIKNLFVSSILVMIISCVVIAVGAFIKIEPIAMEYYVEAKDAVNDSTEETFLMSDSSYIYDSDGKLLIKLKADKDSVYLTYEDIPTDLVDAFVAVEDRNFWEHGGIDFKGLVRVVVDFIQTKGEEMHGASTITQQLSRNIFLSHEVSIERKVKEMLISVLLTQKYSKEQIMEFYINDICFANAYYGIEAASIGYFNKHANELTLSQLAYLAAIPNAPSYYDPYKNPERTITRRDKILGDMLELTFITQEEYDMAIKEEIVIVRPTYSFNDYQSTYAIDCATRYLMDYDGFDFKYEFNNKGDYDNYQKDYGKAYDEAKYKLYNGGYHIYTTLDSTKQEQAQQIVDKTLLFNREVDENSGIYKLQGAATIIDNQTGKVIAVIGGRRQEQSTYSLNRAFQSPRQPGSSIKPLIAYAPSVEEGLAPNSMVKNVDVELAKEKGPENIDKIGGKKMTMRSALEQSKNGVAWYLFAKLTPKVGLSYITDMNFSHITLDDYYEAASLGGFTYGTTTVEMAGAYAALANHGVFREVTCIEKMIDKRGEDIYREAAEKQIYTKEAADTTIDMMKGVLTRGTASSLGWYNKTSVEAAAKTGTTNDNKDGWLCGATPYYSVAVWVGYDTPKEMPSLWGNSYPGQIWQKIMLEMLGNTKTGKFKQAKMEEMDEDVAESYYSYMPDRDDSEIISPNYTVGDYRSDRVIGESVDKVISEMNAIGTNEPTYESILNNKFKEGQELVNTIYSVSYKEEKGAELQEIYDRLLSIHRYGDVIDGFE